MAKAPGLSRYYQERLKDRITAVDEAADKYSAAVDDLRGPDGELPERLAGPGLLAAWDALGVLHAEILRVHELAELGRLVQEIETSEPANARLQA